ncbi:MAG TPA: hypothetical protein DCO79_10280 [Spirochaeta sp.]|nr:hypothetical protein [Spirochaeta sp.]
MKFYRIFSLFIFITAAVTLEAESPASSSELLRHLDDDVLNELELNNIVFRYDDELFGNLYLPNTDRADSIREIYESSQPEVMVEAVYKIPYPEGYDLSNILEHLYELSHRVSTISGAKYFSERRNRYAVLFTDVYAVNITEKKKHLADPKPGDENYSDELYMHMKENALGRGYYKLDYNLEPEIFTLKISNMTDLKFIVTAVKSNDLDIVLQIIPCSDTLLIYGYCGVVMQNDDFVNLLLDPYYAFYRRLTAMETWLYNSLHSTDILPLLNEPMP